MRYLACSLTLLLALGCQRAAVQPPSAWQAVDAILARIQAPVFPDLTVDVRSAGAVADGQTDDRAALQRAIEDCHARGGGRVMVPAGTYFCDGPLHLRSGVNLHLAEGAIIRFGTDPERYTPLVKVRWEGTVCYNYSPLVYAYRQQNIAITGPGLLDGQAAAFWHAWKRGNEGQNQDRDKPVLRQMGHDGVPEDKRIFGNGNLDTNGDGINDGDGMPHYLRPSLVEFFECEHILLEGFTAQGSPFWTIHPVFCKNVTIRGLNILRGTTNDDGIDPDSCEDVLIENCTIDTHDDPVSIKAGRDQDAWGRPGSRHIVVRNCTVSCEVGNGFCIGSEMSGGVENVYVEGYHIRSTDNGVNFKCNLDRGGWIRNVHLRDITIDACAKHGILFQMDYHGYRGGQYPPDFRDFHLGNIRVGMTGKAAIKIAGVASQPVRQVHLKDISVGSAPQLMDVRHTEDLVQKAVRSGK